MTDARDAVEALQKFGAEATSIEAKRSQFELPKSVRETLSSFSNTAGGGTLLLGVEEVNDFEILGVADPAKIMADLASMSRDQMVPPLQLQISVDEVDGCNLIVADVPELPKTQKPCYVKAQGLERGSYLRVADSDRRLTPEEVQQIVADRGQPVFDHEVVLEAEVEDLDDRAVTAYVGRMRDRSPRIFSGESDQTVLKMTKVVSRGTDGKLHPTLAGLLALGRFPQQFFPQLNVTFVHYPTPTGEATATGVRFLDNISLDGPIPIMTSDALSVIQRNMSRRASITGGGRRDVWEYPPEALREAVVNALVHRDLSPGSRGVQVQIEMYPDRLRIMNTGGLFGAVDIERLGEEGRSSARNSLLMKLLEEVEVPDENRTVCENRGSGIRAMLAALRLAGMSPPRFKDSTTAFEVLLPNHTLLDDETVVWLQILGREGLKDTQCTALALMRRGEVLDNSKYRAATGIADSRAATFELQDLVARELVTQTGTRGGARYTLSEYAEAARAGRRRVRPNRRQQVLDLLALRGELSKSAVSDLLSVNPKTAEHWLRTLKAEGDIVATEPGRGSKHTRYRLTDQGRQISLFDEESKDE